MWGLLDKLKTKLDRVGPTNSNPKHLTFKATNNKRLFSHYLKKIWAAIGEGKTNIMNHVRYMGLKWLLFLIGPLYLIGTWFSEYQRANIIK